MIHRLNPVLALAAALLLLAPATLSANTDTWPGFRGGPFAPGGALPESFGLAIDWNRELGSGYSSVAVQDGVLVTMFTSGEDDVLAAFDTADGAEKWRVRLAEKYAAHDGSDDGPLGSPTLAGGRVFALGPHGQLVAADLESGKEQWRVQLDESNSNVPFYGYTSSPLAVDDLVIVLAGGEGRAITAYSQESGELRWSHGDDSVTYQSPIVAEVAGRRQVIAVTDQWAFGVEPGTGKRLWSYQHSTGETRQESAHPTLLDADHLLIDLDNESLALRLSADGGGLKAEETWRSRAFANSLVLPVVHGGHIFGFTGRILTAASAETGEILWRSRAAQGLNLSLVDGHLAVVTGDGELVLAEATAEEYTEKTRLKVFERGDYADPAFAGGHLYVRNQTHLASVRVDAGVAPEVAEEEVDEHRHLGEFGGFIQGLEKAPKGERQAKVDAYFDGKSVPLVEASGAAHIVYRGDAEDVSVQGTLLGWDGRDAALHHVAGTDLRYRSFQLDPKGVYDYALGIDFARPAADPANPVRIAGGFVELSELRLPGAGSNAALAEPAEDAARGNLHTFRFHSAALENAREVQIWTPPGFGGEEKYPLLVVNHGNTAVTSGLMGNVLDNLTGKSVRPVVVAFVPRAAPAEYNGDAAPSYAKFLVEELIPHLERHYQAGDQRAIMGPGSAGVISLHTALAFPGIFDQVAIQSFYLTDNNRDDYWKMVGESTAKPKVWVATGPNDYVISGPGIQAERSSLALIEKLEGKGIEVEKAVTHGAAGWVTWRDQSDDILEAFFPADS